jgi:hypothetical protein
MMKNSSILNGISAALRKSYESKGYASVNVKEIERSFYPPSVNHDEYWQYMPAFPMVYSDPPTDVAPLPPKVNLRAETFQMDNGVIILRIWHGYCVEDATVYFAALPLWVRG